MSLQTSDYDLFDSHVEETVGSTVQGWSSLLDSIVSGGIDSSVLSAFPNPVDNSSGLLSFAGIGSVTQAWSPSLDSFATITPDSTVLTALEYSINAAPGLVQFDGSGLLPGLGVGVALALTQTPNDQGGVAILNSLAQLSVVAGLIAGGGVIITDDGQIRYPDGSTPLTDTSNNLYSTLSSGLVLVSGGSGSPITGAAFDSSALTAAANPVDTSGGLLSFAGIGSVTQAWNANLDIVTAGGSATTGYVLQSDGDGTLSFVAPGGSYMFSTGLTNTSGTITVNIGTDVQAWSSLLDSIVSGGIDSSVLSAFPSPVDTANGLVTLDGSGNLVVFGGGDIVNDGGIFRCSLGYYISTGVPLTDGAYLYNPATSAKLTDSSGNLYYGDGTTILTAGISNDLNYGNGSILADASGNLYSNTDANSILVSGGIGSPIAGSLFTIDGSGLWANGVLSIGYDNRLYYPSGVNPVTDYDGSNHSFLIMPSGDYLADHLGNTYSNLIAGTIIVSGGANSPTVSAADDTSTPTNTSTPAGWTHININGADAWLPYYQ